MKATKLGIVSVLLASVCCVGPLVLVLVGASGVLGLGAIFSRYHWWFTAGAALLLAWAWRAYLKEQAHCADQHCEMNGKRQAKISLTLATAIVAGFGALNDYSAWVAAKGFPTATSLASVHFAKLTLPVEGMTCMSCALTIKTALKKVPGVIDASASVAGHSATVEFDPAQVAASQLEETVRQAGYRVKHP